MTAFGELEVKKRPDPVRRCYCAFYCAVGIDSIVVLLREMTRKIPRLFKFLLLVYISAFIFETVPRIVLIEVFKAPQAVYLWDMGDRWWIFFLVWYAFIFLASHALFQRRPLWQVVAFGVLVGTLAETFLFGQMNPISFFLFPIFYGGMFYLPFKLIRIDKLKSNGQKSDGQVSS